MEYRLCATRSYTSPTDMPLGTSPLASPAGVAQTPLAPPAESGHAGLAGSFVAVKYAGREDAVPLLAAKVQKGGTGVWGTAVMPPNPVTPDEARELVTWILTLKEN